MVAIREGDVLAFVGNPRNIGHRIIMACQRYNGGDDDGLWRVVHVEQVIKVGGQLCAVGFRLTRLFPWPRGGRQTVPLMHRLIEYKHGILHLWLDGDARNRLDTGKLRDFWRKVRAYSYNIPGLIFAIMRWFIGWRRAGSYFCSEYVRDSLSKAEAWNGERGLLAIRDGRPERIDARVEPQRFSPWDICRAPVFGGWQVINGGD